MTGGLAWLVRMLSEAVTKVSRRHSPADLPGLFGPLRALGATRPSSLGLLGPLFLTASQTMALDPDGARCIRRGNPNNRE